MSELTLPSSTIFATSTVAASETRRPSSKRDLEAEPLHVVGDVGPAAVDDHRVQPDVLEQDDVAREVVAQRLVAHRRAAVLDDDRAAVELADVGQRLEQRLDAALGRPRPLRRAAAIAHVVYSALSVDVLVGEVAEEDVGRAAAAAEVDRDLRLGAVLAELVGVDVAGAELVDVVLAGERHPRRLGDPAPVRVAAVEGGLDQRRVGDRAGDALGLARASRPRRPRSARRGSRPRRRRRSRARAGAGRRRAAPAGSSRPLVPLACSITVSLVLICPSTVIRSNDDATARRSSPAGILDDGVGLHEAEHGREARLDHPRALRLGGERHAAELDAAALRPAVGGHDRRREVASALRAQLARRLVDPVEDAVDRQRDADRAGLGDRDRRPARRRAPRRPRSCIATASR